MLLGVTQKMGFEVEEEVILVNLSEIMEMMKGITEGKLIAIVETCKRIAKKHKVKGYCSLTTGIYIITVAIAAKKQQRKIEV